MNRNIFVISFLLLLKSWHGSFAQSPTHDELLGKWSATLETAGGDLNFELEFSEQRGNLNGWIINDPERIKIPRLAIDEGTLVVDIDHYDSTITAKYQDGQLEGLWQKRRGKDNIAKVPFRASRKLGTNEYANPEKVLGRWQVRFEGDQDPAVAIVKKLPDSNRLSATFLTTTGDYRYLVGSFDKQKLTLSCFDGAHAFLFTASLDENNRLNGKFHSGNWWNTKWTAVKDSDAKLADDFKQTAFVDGTDLAAIRFPDLNGKPRSLMDTEFTGKARLIYVFGSWCPNCHDAAEFLVELDKEYGNKGLSILGLAFELTGDFERDAGQLKKYLARHDATYPVLIAGLSDKSLASKALPFLDKVRSYPTTIFMDDQGKVHAIHTGFTGPATGKKYTQLKQKFKQQIESLLKK